MVFKKVSSKIDFVQLERKILKYWDRTQIVEQYLVKNQEAKKKFRFLDGPITANNPMGVHHAWGRTYKDLWQRFYNMLGFCQRFQNGFDEQGLWVEVEVEKELGFASKKEIESFGIDKFVNLCKERVKKYSKIQTEQSQRLGYFMDWKNSYHTSSDENNYAIWHYLKTMHQKGWLYKGRDTVPWCPRCGTAISQHEILTEEYQEIKHQAVYFCLPLMGRENEYLLVWTTTPWTIPANVSVALDPQTEYQLVEAGGKNYWLVNQRVGAIFSQKPRLVKKTKGEELVGLTYFGPFDDLSRVQKAKREGNFHTVISAKDLITVDEGTGLVHIAPGAGEEDFKLGRENNLPVIEVIDEEANYLDGLGKFSGQNAKVHPEIILSYLKEKDSGRFFFRDEWYLHRYPICWRCKTELVWRVVDEWYIAMDKPDPNDGKTYRQKMIEVAKKIEWIPSWGLDRELDWLVNMHDWLISKKRYWGLALPIWECHSCHSFEVVGSKEELEEKAIEGWEEFAGNSPHRPWVDEVKVRCPKCKSLISRIRDVGNPWLDAGIVPFSTINYFSDKKFWREWFPADFITESFPGQFKNWFYSLIAMSTGLENTAPFRNLLGYGLVRDEKGEEMHKSKGNAIEFNEAAEKIGVDVMRWLYLRTKAENNVNFGYHVANEIRRLFILRLWNVYVFLVNYALIDKWKPIKTKFVPAHVLDRWILSRLNANVKNITWLLDGLANQKFDAAEALGNAENFIDDLSNWYVRRVRDRVGPAVKNSKDKDDVYQTLWQSLVTFSKILAPMIPFVSEEMFRNLTGEKSVHLAGWPKVDKDLINSSLEDEMLLARSLTEAVHAQRKKLHIKVRQPLSKVEYQAPKKLRREVEEVVAEEVNVKKVNFKKKLPSVKVKLDTRLTEKLVKEGQARELVRQIQELRKTKGLKLDAKIIVKASNWPKEFETQIKNETLASKIVKGKNLDIKKV